MAATVLLIEDNEDHRRLLTRVLREADESFEVVTARDGRTGLKELGAQRVDCVVLDYHLPDTDGLRCLQAIREAHGDVPVVMITGDGSEEVVLEALRLGAADYVPKRGRYLLDLLVRVRTALKSVEETIETAAQRRLPWDARERYRREGIVGRSRVLEEALVLAEQAAQSRATVFLEGETGTGKELFARAIHAHGPRAKAPFLAQNCAALPETLLESELFGCARGAYTGADRPRRGLLEAAHGGTLFLDEVSEMPPTLQAKLLRVLQDGLVRPLGGSEARVVDVRVLAATNRDPVVAVQSGRLREDLYYRLSVLPIRLPPLRERRRDVPLLAMHFLAAIAAQEGRRLAAFEPRAMRILDAYSWPGNVRELQNEIHRIVVHASGDDREVTVAMLAPKLTQGELTAPDAPPTLRAVLDDATRRTIVERLQLHAGNRRATAKSLGVSREWLWAMMRRLGIDAPPRDGD